MVRIAQYSPLWNEDKVTHIRLWLPSSFYCCSPGGRLLLNDDGQLVVWITEPRLRGSVVIDAGG